MWRETWIFELAVTLSLFIWLKRSFHQKSSNYLQKLDLNSDVIYDFTINSNQMGCNQTNELVTARNSSNYFPAKLR